MTGGASASDTTKACKKAEASPKAASSRGGGAGATGTPGVAERGTAAGRAGGAGARGGVGARGADGATAARGGASAALARWIAAAISADVLPAWPGAAAAEGTTRGATCGGGARLPPPAGAPRLRSASTISPRISSTRYGFAGGIGPVVLGGSGATPAEIEPRISVSDLMLLSR